MLLFSVGLSTVLLFILLVLFAAQHWDSVFRRRLTLPAVKVAVASLLSVVGLLLFALGPAPAWIDWLAFVNLLCGMLLIYCAVDQLRSDEEVIIRRPMTIIIIGVLVLGGGLALIGQDSVGFIITSGPDVALPYAYILFNLLFFGSQIPICIGILIHSADLIRTCWDDDALELLVRYLTCDITVGIIILADAIEIINTGCVVVASAVCYIPLNIAYFAVLSLVGLPLLINVIPSAWLIPITQRLHMYKVARDQWEQHLLEGLRTRLVHLAPNVQIPGRPNDPDRLFIEIAHARRYVGTHTPHKSWFASVRREATAIMNLDGVVLLAKGPYPPFPKPRHARRHYLALARELQRRQKQPSRLANPRAEPKELP